MARSWTSRHRGACALSCLLVAATSARAQNDGTHVNEGRFDADAPTVAFEEIDEINRRAGDQEERRRNASLRASEACLNGARAPGAAAAAAPPTSAIRADLRDKSLQELSLMYQRNPDPDIATAIQVRAAQAQPSGAAPSPPAPDKARSPEALLLEQLGRQQATARDTSAQDCLARVERDTPDVADPLHPVFDRAAFPLRKGRVPSVVIDFDGELPKQAYLGVVQRFNIVSRSGPHGAKVMPLAQAQKAAWHPQGIYWPALDLTAPAPGASAATAAKPRASPLDALRTIKDKLQKATEVPR